jgi:hypothetical protein
MKAYGRVKAQLQACLNSALGEVASASLFGQFTPEESTPFTQGTKGWVDLRAVVDNGDEENLLPVLATKPRFISRPARSRVTVPTEVLRFPDIM